MNGWQWAWLVGVYLSVLACFVAIIRIGWLASSWWEGFKQLLVFLGFCVGYWLLESWAHMRAPFYLYPDIFPDRVPFFTAWPSWAPTTSAAAMMHECARMGSGLSATVPLAGGIITFTLLWTARLLLDGAWLITYRPVTAVLAVGTAALFLDLYLDPILATSFDCQSVLVHAGMEYWQWFTHPDFADRWFRIPLFNFAAWYAAPALLASIVILISGALSFTTAQDLMLRGLIMFLLFAIFFSAPGANPPVAQTMLVVFLVVLGLYYVIRDWNTYTRTHPLRWELVLPLLFFLLYPIVALLLAAAVPLSIPLLLVALVLGAIGTIYTLSPYVKWP